MLPTSKAYVWDAQQACLAALSFVAGESEASFQRSLLLQSAVERQLEILGRRSIEYGATILSWRGQFPTSIG